jgi:hypothetical protein
MRSRRAVALWALVVGYAAAIFVLSSLPSPAAVEEPAALVGDKALHLLEYGILAAFLAFALSTHASSRVRSRAALLALSSTSPRPGGPT